MTLINTKNIKSTLLFAVAVAFVASLLTQLHVSAANTVPGNNTLVSVNSVDGQGENGDGAPAAISTDGNVVLFQSGGTNISSGSGLYERNIKLGTTTAVNVSSSGVASSYGGIYGLAMSETGRYVVFTTGATNLIDGTTEPVGQTYIRDVQLGVTSIVSVRADGSAIGNTTQMSGDWDKATGVSNDGKFVTIDSEKLASYGNPGNNIRTGYYDVVRVDTTKHTYQVIDTPSNGSLNSLQNYYSQQSSMSCDGALVVFGSHASNLISGTTLSGDYVYLADLRGSTPVVSVISGSQSMAPHISCNGDYITYATQNRTDITPTPTGMDSYAHNIEYNRIIGTKIYVDSNSAGTIFNNWHNVDTGTGTVLLPDTGFVSVDDSGDLALSYQGAVYIKHISDGSGTLESIEKTSAGTYLSSRDSKPSISANGKYSIYDAHAYDLGLITASSSYYDVIRSETGL